MANNSISRKIQLGAERTKRAEIFLVPIRKAEGKIKSKPKTKDFRGLRHADKNERCTGMTSNEKRHLFIN